MFIMSENNINTSFLENVDKNQVAVALAVKEIFNTVISQGLGQPIRLFSLVKSSKIVDLPGIDDDLKTTLKNSIDFIPEHLSSIEQENIPQIEIDELLGKIKWDEGVDGCALYMEQNAVDEKSKENAPENEKEQIEYYKNHESFTKICVCAGVDRQGTSWTVIKVVDNSGELKDIEESNSGVNLIPEITTALLTTFE